jgi:hypothetical protein
METSPYHYLEALATVNNLNYAGPGEILPVKGGVLQASLVKGMIWQHETGNDSMLIDIAVSVMAAFAAALDAILHTASIISLALKMIPEAVNWKVAGSRPHRSLADQIVCMGGHFISAGLSVAMILLIPIPAAVAPKGAIRACDLLGLTDNVAFWARQKASYSSSDSYSISPLQQLKTIGWKVSQLAKTCIYKPARWVVTSVTDTVTENPHLSVVVMASVAFFYAQLQMEQAGN